MYLSITAAPRQVPFMLAESMRVQSAMEKEVVQQLEKTATKAARFKEVIADEVEGHFEFFRRLRAYWWTLAWLCIQFREWFSFQDALFMSERILALINQTHFAMRPPVAHYTQAWAKTITRISDIVRTTKVTLAAAVKQTAHWEHLWEFAAQPGGMSSSASNQHPSHSIPDTEEDLRKQLERTRAHARQLQSEKDKATAALKRKTIEDNRLALPRKYNGGKGSKGGKGGKK